MNPQGDVLYERKRKNQQQQQQQQRPQQAYYQYYAGDDEHAYEEDEEEASFKHSLSLQDYGRKQPPAEPQHSTYFQHSLSQPMSTTNDDDEEQPVGGGGAAVPPPWLRPGAMTASNPYAQAAAEGVRRSMSTAVADDNNQLQSQFDGTYTTPSRNASARSGLTVQQTGAQGHQQQPSAHQQPTPSSATYPTLSSSQIHNMSNSQYFVVSNDNDEFFQGSERRTSGGGGGRGRGASGGSARPDRAGRGAPPHQQQGGLQSPGGYDGDEHNRGAAVHGGGSNEEDGFTKLQLEHEVRRLTDQLQERDRLLARALSESRLLTSQLNQERALRRGEVMKARQDTFATLLHVLQTEGAASLERNASNILQSMHTDDTRRMNEVLQQTSTAAGGGGPVAGGGASVMKQPPVPSIHTSEEARDEFQQMLRRSRQKLGTKI